MLDIVPFTEDLIAPAAILSAANYERFRQFEPALPPQWLDVQARAIDIAAAKGSGPGVAAFAGRELVGFLIATLDLGGMVPDVGWPTAASLGGVRSALIRIGHHTAAHEDPTATYRSMFASFARQLVDQQCFRHSITTAVCDLEAVGAWFGLGFGVDQILGTRDLAPLTNTHPELKVRKAEPTDIEAVLRLNFELQRYHTNSPVFLPVFFAHEPVRRDLLEAMKGQGRALWLAERERDVLGVMEISGVGRPSFNNARSTTSFTIGTASIGSESRAKGVGSAILSGVFEWARGQGLDRCTVGWSSANIVSDAFWRRRGFRPVHYTLTRHLDERIGTQL